MSFTAGYQHRNFIKHSNDWVKAHYERKKEKKKDAFDSTYLLFEFKESQGKTVRAGKKTK